MIRTFSLVTHDIASQSEATRWWGVTRKRHKIA